MITSKIQFFLCLSLGLLFANCVTPRGSTKASDPDPVQAAIDSQAATFLSDPTIGALSIGVLKSGTMYTAHYGELDKGKGNKPTDQTIYDLASISKPFAGLLVAHAEMGGRLKLDDDIRNYLPGDFANLEYEGHPILIRHLLTHTSRLPKFLPASINLLLENPTDSLAFDISRLEHQYSKQNFMSDLKAVVIDTIPGTKYDYSNADTEVIACLLENLYGKPYEQLLKDVIWTPRGMSNTYIKLPGDSEKFMATGYTTNGAVAPPMTSSLWGAGGGIKSTVPDMVNFMRYQLDTTDQLVALSHKVLFEFDSEKISYYWPVNTDDVNGTYVSHHGGAFGMQGLLFVIPKSDLGIIVFTNQSLPDTAEKIYGIMDGLLNDLR